MTGLPATIALLSGVLFVAGCAPATDDANDLYTVEMSGDAAGLAEQLPAGFDACALLSEAEAAEASGQQTAGAESAMSRFGIATCTFEPATGPMPPVVLEVRGSEGAFETALEMAAGADQLNTLSNVGDRAFYSTLAGHNIALVSGGRYANLIVRRDAVADNRERALELARLVAARLRE